MLFQDSPSPDPSENLCSEYALRDTFRTLYGWDHALSAITEDGLFDQLARQMRAFPAFCQLPTQGLPIHRDNLNGQIKTWTKKANATRKLVEKTLADYGIEEPNAASPHHVREMLYEGLKLPVLKKTATQLASTDAETIKALSATDLSFEAEEFLTTYQKFKSEEKTVSTLVSYTKRIIRAKSDGVEYLFGDFKQTGTALTRCSSDNPNLQNIPKRKNSLRNIIGGIPGWRLVSIDYSQIEIRLFAQASQDPEMLAAIASGKDIHAYTASEVFSLPYEECDGDSPIQTERGKKCRDSCKGVNFGILYGASEDKIIRTIGNAIGWTIYQEKFPNVFKYMLKMKAIARELGEVRTLFGYRIWIAPEPLHVAVNCVVQGSAGDAAKEAMALIHYENLPIRMAGQVHDELLFYVPDSPDWIDTANRLKTLMEKVGDLVGCALPADADYHPEHWGEGVKLHTLTNKNVTEDKEEGTKRRRKPRSKVLLLSRSRANRHGNPTRR